MSASHVTITREQRDMLHRELVTTMSGIGDLFTTLERGDCSYLLDMRRRYYDALWLADDLGWSLLDPRDEFVVTLPPTRFARWIDETFPVIDDALLSVAESLQDPDKHAARWKVSVEEIVDDAHEVMDRELDLLTACRAVRNLIDEEVAR